MYIIKFNKTDNEDYKVWEILRTFSKYKDARVFAHTYILQFGGSLIISQNGQKLIKLINQKQFTLQEHD